MKKNIPTYEIFIDEDEDSFVSFVSLVDKPATEKLFQAFSEHKEFKFDISEERNEILGIAMVPDMEIYRKDPDTGAEYNVYFSKNTIRQIAQVFFKKQFNNNINLSHTDLLANSYAFQSFIVDSEKGITYPNAVDGSWILGCKVESPEVWQDVKEGKFKGFSVEGIFQFNNQKNEEEELLSLLKEFNSLSNHKS